jgi:uncharacterized protein
MTDIATRSFTKHTTKNLFFKFLSLTLLISWIGQIPFALRAQKVIDFSLPFFLIYFMGLVPAIVAFFLVKGNKEHLQSLKASIVLIKVPITTVLVSILLPALCLTVAYLVNPNIKIFLSYQTIIFAIVWFIFAYGEEIGWRGLALPELSKKFSVFTSATIVGIFWCIWHYPKGLSNYYITDWSKALQGMGMFSLQILLANYILSWLYFKSNRSVFITSLFHASFNVTATIYFNMAMDIYVTSILALTVIVLLVLDRKMFFKLEEVPAN